MIKEFAVFACDSGLWTALPAVDFVRGSLGQKECALVSRSETNEEVEEWGMGKLSFSFKVLTSGELMGFLSKRGPDSTDRDGRGCLR